jgi:hypothetical protein
VLHEGVDNYSNAIMVIEILLGTESLFDSFMNGITCPQELSDYLGVILSEDVVGYKQQHTRHLKADDQVELIEIAYKGMVLAY